MRAIHGLIAGFLALSFVQTAKAQPAETNENLSSALLFDAEPTIAISTADPNRLVAAWMGTSLFRVTIHTRASTDGGVTWSAVQSMPHSHPSYVSADVSCKFNSNGNAFLCYVDYKATGDSGVVMVARSQDGGLTWQPPVVVRNLDETNDKAIDRPWLEIDKSGGAFNNRLYVTTKPYFLNANPNHLHLKYSSDDGATWSNDIRVDDSIFAPAVAGSMGVMSIGQAGKLYLGYFSYDAKQSLLPRLISATSTDGGVTFDKHEIAKMIVVPDSDYQFGYTIAANHGRADNAIFAWIDTRNGDPDVLSSFTTDGGTTWSAPMRVNDDAVNSGVGQDMVWAAFDPFGGAALAWRDRRGLGVGSKTQYNLYGAISRDGGASFKKNEKLTNSPSNFSSLTKGNDFIGIDLDTTSMYVAWGNYTSNWEVFFDKHPVNQLSAVSASSVLASALVLSPIFPNPANTSATIRFQLDRATAVGVHLYAEDGALVRSIPEQQYAQGDHELELDIAGLTAGVYWCELTGMVGTRRAKLIVRK